MSLLPVSVVIPTYNRAGLVSRAISSALAIVEPGDEIIVADDGSTDATADTVTKFGSSQIRYLQLEHRGAGPTRNAGIAAARNPLIAFLDSDDGWMPNKLALQRPLMQRRPDLVFCCSNFAVQAGDEVIHRYLERWQSMPRTWEELFGPPVAYSSLGELPDGCEDFQVHMGSFYHGLLLEGCVFTTTLVVRRELAGNAFRFPDDLPTYEDWECFALLARCGPGAFLDTETAWNYGHSGPRLTNAGPLVCATTRLTILSRIWGQDERFLASHRDEFEQVVQQQRLIRLKEFIREGRTDDARQELQSIAKAPLPFRLAARVPSKVFPTRLLRTLIEARRHFRPSAHLSEAPQR